MINFEGLINSAVKKEREHKEQTSWYISQLGTCMRGQYLQRIGKKPDSELDARTLRVFDMGNKIEDWVVELVRQNEEYKMETQVHVVSEDLGISGYIDLVLEKDGEKVVYEIKSKQSRAFWYMDKEGKANHHHEIQLFCYLYLTGIPEGGIIYVSKDDMTIREYVVSLRSEELRSEMMKIIETLNKAWKTKNPKLLPLPDDKDWTAKYCSFHSQCKKI